MSVGFVDPAFFETIRVGSVDSLPAWARETISNPGELVPSIVLQRALRDDGSLPTRNDNIPQPYQKSEIARVFFSQTNVEWCQHRILQKIYAVTQRRVGLPDTTNVLELISIVWEEALQMSFVQIPLDLRQAVSRLDRCVVDRACDDMLVGIRAQSAYVTNVSKAPLYDDPNLTTAYVGGTKLSAGTLSNSSLLPDAGDVQAFGLVSKPSFRLKAMDEPLY